MKTNKKKKTPKASARPLILVANDDGVQSEGIRILAKALKRVGRVVVVAPSQEKSAASHSLTLHRPLRCDEIEPNVYSVDGTPTDCINLALTGILQELPSVVVSGINKGGNLGDDVHYSGTVSAAMEACIQGVPAIAMSCDARTNFKFEAAADFAVRLTKSVLKNGLPPGIMLNVNVPNLPKNKIKGYEFTIQGKRRYGDLVKSIDPRGRAYYWIGGGDEGFDDIPGSDCNVAMANKISITPIRADMTSYHFLNSIKNWKIS